MLGVYGNFPYFSTPSSLQHPAYDHWSGKKFNKNRTKKLDIDLTDKTLKLGSLGADKIWRHLVTVEDAERMGCDLFDIAELKAEYSKSDFENLFCCQFVDDNESVFPMKTLQKCMVDISEWADVDYESNRPIGNRPAAVGYDPSRVRDNAALVVLEVPTHAGKKWRVIETQQFKGITSEYQANRIKEVYDRFNVVWCGIDETGIGVDVVQCCNDLKLKYIIPIWYTPAIKVEMVARAKRLIDGGRFEYDTRNKALGLSLMMINQITTANGTITYGAGRQNLAGHADLAWATFHGMTAERQHTKSKKPEKAMTKSRMAMSG